MLHQETVTVIIPTKNRPVLLDEAIASACEQTYRPKEIIVVDDGSSEPIDQRILQERHGTCVRVLCNGTSYGLAYSRNHGVENCSSDYIIHLDDDDLLAPEAIARCMNAARAHPEVKIWFFDTRGFGLRSEHFNKVQSEGVAYVCRAAGGREYDSDIILFDRRLFPILLHRVPIAFQRVFTTPATWTTVSQLRWRAYMQNSSIFDEAAAKLAISGTLRDSEWARYAAAICEATGLVKQPLYRQRCDEQGYSSKASNKENHVLQSTAMAQQMMHASRVVPALATWKREIKRSLARSRFNAAYFYAQLGKRTKSWKQLIKAILARPDVRQLRLAVRLCVPSFFKKVRQ